MCLLFVGSGKESSFQTVRTQLIVFCLLYQIFCISGTGYRIETALVVGTGRGWLSSIPVLFLFYVGIILLTGQ